MNKIVRFKKRQTSHPFGLANKRGASKFTGLSFKPKDKLASNFIGAIQNFNKGPQTKPVVEGEQNLTLEGSD